MLTSFAGSIGIIGIALILALSTGMNAYITDVQKDTMASYPITIREESLDVSGVMGMRGEMIGEMRDESRADSKNRTGVFADYREIETSERISSNIVENNLTEFKKYLDDPDSEIRQYLGENGIIYTYNVNFSVYSHDADGRLIDSDCETGASASPMSGGRVGLMNTLTGSGALGGSSSAGAANFSELMAGADGKTVSQVVTDSYDLLYGAWPEEYNEIILVLDENNGIPAGTLYQLGLITKEQYEAAVGKIENGEAAAEIRFAYEDVCSHTLYLVPACDHYIENENGTFTYIDDITLNEEALLANAVELKITGVIRPKEDAQNAGISTAAAYISHLTEYVIAHTDESAVIKAQVADSDINVLRHGICVPGRRGKGK